MNSRLRMLFALVPILCSQAMAGSTGKIAGTVKDSQTGEAVVGASVKLEGTSQGAATNLDGYYVILNVPPGKYSLTASAVGYNKMMVNNASVSIDLTTTIDFTLSATVVEVGEVVATASRPLVQKDLTATTAVVSADQIQALPVTEISQVLNLQAGYVDGKLRGGRSGEVAYWIDGIPVNDAYDRTQVVEVNKNLVEEVQLVSGAFNAEYGQAMSGIVNIATKEGSSKFSGGVGSYIGSYYTTASNIFPADNTVRPTAIRNFEANLSGPVTGEDLTFFGNGRYYYTDGYLFGFNRFNPSNVSYTDSAGTFHLFRDPSGRGDSSRVSMNSSERRYFQGKLTWHVSPTIKVLGNYIYDWTKSRPYSGLQTDYRNYYFDPNGFGFEHVRSNTFILQMTQSLSSRTFYTLGGSVFWKVYRYSLYDDLADPRYVHPNVAIAPDVFSFKTGGTDMRYTRHSTTTFLAKGDISSQVTQSHLLKIGFQVQQHKIGYENITLQPSTGQTSFNSATSNPYIQTQILDISSNSHDLYTHRPLEVAAYAQDKMEFKDFIVNIGVRFDYFRPDGKTLNEDHPDPTDPLYYTYTLDDPNIYNPIKPNNRFFDNNGNGIQDPGEPDKTYADRAQYWYKKATAKWQISPRIGFSFPITDRGIVHFSYGHFFQIPQFQYLYDNPFFKVGPGTSNILGNADLKAEQTINGELGLQQQLTEDISADVTAYLRDVRNLTSTRSELLTTYGGAIQFSRYVNTDFGLIKGIVLSVNKRFSGGLTASMDYTYQVAKGTASDPKAAYNAFAGGQQPEVQLRPLDWDQLHTLNVSIAYSQKSWGASAIGQYGSGTPFTPRATTDISSLLTNSQMKPSFLDLDLRFFYDLPVSTYHVVAFLRIFNVFDIRNALNVFDDSGRPDFTIDETNAIKSNASQFVNSLDQWYTVPTHYSEPRRIEFGLNLEF